MFFILPCPTCGKKLRFPLDRGKIRITCTCGAGFIADPDDTALYKRGSFDIAGAEGKTSIYQKIRSSLKRLTVRDMREAIIKRTIDYRYRLQNFRLLPAAEQKKMLIRLLLIVMVISLLLFFFIASRRTGSVGGTII